MAVDPDQLAAISRETVTLYRAAENAILQHVTRQLAKGMEAPTWAVQRLAAVGVLRRTVGGILRAVRGGLKASVRRALAKAYRSGEAQATTGVPASVLANSDAEAAATAVRAVIPRAKVVENLAVALVDDIGAKHSNVVRDVVDIYRRVIAEATAVSVAGGMTRLQASQHAYARLVDKGVTGFTDVSGRRWRLSSYVEMAVRTVTQRAAVQGQTDKQLRLGLPLSIVSNEAQECIRCRPFEGKVIRLDDGPIGEVQARNPVTGAWVTVHVVATLEQARAAGLFHPSCRHSLRTYLPGVTKLPERPTADPEGDEARQRQRAIERAIRRWKEREQAALDPAAATAARSKVRAWQGAMRDHMAANPGLRRLSYREQIGAGNIPATTT